MRISDWSSDVCSSDLGKEPTLANKRLAFARLRDRAAVVALFAEICPRYAARNGGYTRVLKMGFRQGDSAPVAYMALAERPEVEETEAAPAAQPAGPWMTARAGLGARPRFYWWGLPVHAVRG